MTKRLHCTHSSLVNYILDLPAVSRAGGINLLLHLNRLYVSVLLLLFMISALYEYGFLHFISPAPAAIITVPIYIYIGSSVNWTFVTVPSEYFTMQTGCATTTSLLSSISASWLTVKHLGNVTPLLP